jgi:hypothetical protein
MNKLKNFALLIVAVLISGCTSTPTRKNMTIDESIFEKKPKIIIAQIEDFKGAVYHKTGAQGFLDVAINHSVTNGDFEALRKLDSRPILDKFYYQAFEKTLAGKGAKVFLNKTPIDIKNLHKMPDDNIHVSPFDLTFLKDKNKYEYALILQPMYYGITRNYYGFIPTGAPNGMASFLVYLVDLNDNTLMGYFKTDESLKLYPVKGYAGHTSCEICDGAKLALEESLRDAHSFLTTFY